ncbi:MAG: outer membrane protein assembly factor BamB [bacterium]|jgi:outer membrane protein assembly factor BamB|nr:outer membrane protein assembly factor BamB [Betaproteobacteria bacterium]
MQSDASRRSLLRALAIAGIAPAAFAGCSTVGGAYDRLFSRAVDPRLKPAELGPIRSKVSLRMLWQGQVGNSGRYVFTPAVDAGQVYAIGTDGNLVAFEAATGRVTWRQQVVKPTAGGVGAGEGRVAVGGQNGEVQVYQQGGKLAWETRLSSEVLAAPRIVDGLVLVRTGDSRIWALEAETGRQRWVYQRGAAPTLSVRTHVGFTIARGALFAGFGNGRLIGLDLKTGAVGLDVAVALPRGATELERVVEITSLPVFEDNQVCAVAFQGRVACFDAQRASLAWSRDISSIAGLDMDARAIYVVDDRSVVHALDRASGASLWRQAALQLRNVGAPRLVGKALVVGDFQGFVHLLDPEDGSFLARLPTDGSGIAIDARPVDRGFVVQTRNGGLYAMGVAA